MDQTTRISRLGLVNAYLVREDDGLTVIDPLLPRSASRILAAAAVLGTPIVRTRVGWTPRGWHPATGRSWTPRGPRWTRRSPERPDPGQRS